MMVLWINHECTVSATPRVSLCMTNRKHPVTPSFSITPSPGVQVRYNARGTSRQRSLASEKDPSFAQQGRKSSPVVPGNFQCADIIFQMGGSELYTQEQEQAQKLLLQFPADAPSP